MPEVGLAASLVLIAGVILHAAAGRYAAGRRAGEEGPSDRSLARIVRHATRLFLLSAILAAAVLVWRRPALSSAERTILFYGAPLAWGWLAVLGATWIEIRGRHLPEGLWRFHRYNLFAAFLLIGQRIPFLSAALAAPADVAEGTRILVPILLHLFAATVLGWGVRVFLVEGFVRVRPLPDARLAVEIRAAARDAGILLRGVLLVPTERGQSVNAMAATSSHYIFVAQGLYEGLDREEVRGVLLHEVGHLGQRVMNLWRSLSIVSWPTLLWALRATGSASFEWPRFAIVLGVTVLGAAGVARVGMWLEARAERAADLFAVRRGDPRRLASALRKIYDLAPPDGTGRPARRTAGSLGERLGRIENLPR